VRCADLPISVEDLEHSQTKILNNLKLSVEEIYLLERQTVIKIKVMIGTGYENTASLPQILVEYVN